MSVKIPVDAEALRRVLSALDGPPHYIRELQVTRNLPGNNNPINTLIDDYNSHFADSPEIQNKGCEHGDQN